MTHSTNAERTAKAKQLIEARKAATAISDGDLLVGRIKQIARRRKFAMKIQQKIDRALESYIRINYTKWRWDLPDNERKKENTKALDIIESTNSLLKAAAKLLQKKKTEEAALLIAESTIDPEIIGIVQFTEDSRSHSDEQRDKAESEMEELAQRLPVADWVESIHGIGLKGLALIVGEAGPLDNYANPQKLWKRLGYAPYGSPERGDDNHYAGSTWKRESWRPRPLTKEEWIANPFSGARYAVMYTLSNWLVNHQCVGKEKSGTKYGQPTGRYGEIYVARRMHTEITHPDWSDGHCRNDALRVTFKQFLVDLWEIWVDQSYSLGHVDADAHPVRAEIAAAGQINDDAHATIASGGVNSKRRGHLASDVPRASAAPAAAGQSHVDAQGLDAGGGTQNRNGGQHSHGAQSPIAAAAAAGQVTRGVRIGGASGRTVPRKRRPESSPT